MMKMSKFRVLIISFFLAFTATFVHARDLEVPFAADLIPAVVTDVNGNALRSGARYYMAVPFAPDVIPFAISDASHGFCPRTVVISDFSNKLPISITPVKSNSTVILEDTYLTVRFNFSYMCRAKISLVWKVSQDGSVTTGGVERVNRFKLTKYEEGGGNRYQLAACPVSECLHDCRCERVGYVPANDDTGYLAVRTEQFLIEFVPATEPRIAYKLPSM